MERILLIEDDRGSQILFHNRLAELGYEVVVAPTGARGLMEARAARFDLFLVDIGLGSGIDGYEVCRRLKAVPQIHGIPVVLISGDVKSRQELHRGYEAGCEAFLVKGDLTLVEDVIRAMLRIRSLQDELATQNRLLEERNRRLTQERQRGVDLEQALRESGGGPPILPSSPSVEPDGVLIVDTEGVVRAADRGAHDIFDKELEGRHLASLAPRTGLEAFVRNARSALASDYRFDLDLGKGSSRSLSASVLPAVLSRFAAGSPDPESARKVVLLRDVAKERFGGELLRSENEAVPRRELGPLIEAARIAFGPQAFLGSSPRRKHVRTALRELAAIDAPVLLTGADGTGKVLAARSIHFSGERSGPFLPFECAAFRAERLEEELFGRAPTKEGSAGSRPGLIDLASDGTLFLRSIEVLPMKLQERLCDVIESGRLPRAEPGESRPVRVRFVASSREDLPGLVKEGRFSQRLLDLLLGFHLQLPPLSASSPDIPILAEHFLARYGAGRGVSLSSEVHWILSEYDWPGNAGELEACIERVCTRAKGEITIRDLPGPLRDLYSRLSPTDFIPSQDAPQQRERRDPLAEAYETITDPAESPSLEAYERKAILHALRETSGDKLAAAKLLGIGKSTFYRKLRLHGIGPGARPDDTRT